MSLFNRRKAIEEVEETDSRKEAGAGLTNRMKALREVGRYSIEQKNKLQDEERTTIEGVDKIRDSFGVVEEKYNKIFDSVDEFHEEFNRVEEITDAFDHIVSELVETADNTHKGMETVDESSSGVSRTIGEVQDVFDQFQNNFDEIRQKVEQISGFANQTNLLALNASIEAARAGEAGRGFAIVADSVNNLSKEIQTVVTSIRESMEELNQNNSRLITSIENTKAAIDDTHEKIVNTQETIWGIRDVADNVTKQSKEMTAVFATCQSSIDAISDNIADSVQYFGKVNEDIEDIKVKITQKGFMFEDMNNVLEQIAPLADLKELK